MMNILIRELKAYRKSLLIWSIGVLFMVAGGMGKYAGYSGSGQSMNDLISKMPKAVQVIIGAGTFHLSKALGFYGMLFIYLILMAAIHAALIGANIIAKEEEDKTAEFLFVKPVSRHKIITSKIMAAFLNILVFNLVTFISSLVMVGHYSQGEAVIYGIGRLMIGMFILQIIFMLLGTGIAAISKKPRSSASAAAALVVVAYLLSIIIDLNNKLDWLKYFTPFKYFEAKHLLFQSKFEPIFIVLSVIIITILFIATYIFYQSRDLNI